MLPRSPAVKQGMPQLYLRETHSATNASPSVSPPLPLPTPPPFSESPAQSPSSPSRTTPLRGCIDADTGILLTTEVPNPPLPHADKDQQLGQKAGSLGRLLPGLTIESTPEGLTITALLPDSPLSATIPGAKMDEQGFLVAK